MIDAVVDFIHHNLGAELAVFIAAAFPVVEVRGAIPLGISLGLSPFDTLVTSLVGSMLPVPFILLALRRLFRFLSQFQPFKKLVDRLTARTLAKGKQGSGTYMCILLFVGVPFLAPVFGQAA